MSRYFPSNSTHQSIYEVIRERENAAAVVEDGGPSSPGSLDERNLTQPFHDQDLDRLLAEEADASHTLPAQTASEPSQSVQEELSTQGLKLPPPPSALDDEPDIPAALLSEDKATSRAESRHRIDSDPSESLPSPVPGPGGRSRVRWDSLANNQTPFSRRVRRPLNHSISTVLEADPEDKAMWMWANVENLDRFLVDVYAYFRGKGIRSLVLRALITQLTLAFIVGFGTFLGACIDYRQIPSRTRLSQVVVPRCTQQMSGISNLALWLFAFFWIATTLQAIQNTRSYWKMHCFFTHVLKISEDELQTITWQTIVTRLMDLRDSNARTAVDVTQRNRRFIGGVSKQRMDAHDIANRLMRKDNYLIALFNKDILDFTLPLPLLRNRPFFSKNLEWHIKWCVMDFVFNEHGQVKQLFLQDSHRRELIEELRRRFAFAGWLTFVTAPFLITYNLFEYFLRYFTEFQREPARLGSRAYSPLAEWKFREFNELYHFFQRRLNMSRPFASTYLDQFPKDKTAQIASFVAFISGALASILAIATLLDHEMFLVFEITKDRTALFYLTVFGTIWAVARGMVPEEEQVFDPEHAINEVTEFTHYKPTHWAGRLHTEDVRREFSALYQMKIVIFLEEVLSIVFTPFLLWLTLPKCSERLVDFFREFTVHVDGLGYVCSFALFEFSKGAPRLPAGTADRNSADNHDHLTEDYYSTKDGKMLSSYYSFMDSYANNGRPTAPRPKRRENLSSRMTSGASQQPADQPRSQGAYRELAQSIRARRTSRLRDTATGSPSPSVLLDARHQPARPHVPRSEQRAVQTVVSPDPHPLSQQDEADEADDDRAISSSALIAEDSNLGDSWRTTMAAGSGGGGSGARTDDDNAAATGAPAGDAGVLGLLYEFQRAQTEGRAAG